MEEIVKIAKYKNIFLVKVPLEIGQEKCLLSILCLILISGVKNWRFKGGKSHRKFLQSKIYFDRLKNNFYRVNYKRVIIQNQIVILEIKLK